MRFVVPMLLALGLVLLMAGRNAARTGESIAAVLVAIAIAFAIFALIADRALSG